MSRGAPACRLFLLFDFILFLDFFISIRNCSFSTHDRPFYATVRSLHTIVRSITALPPRNASDAVVRFRTCRP
jgi:hypothetical protein